MIGREPNGKGDPSHNFAQEARPGRLGGDERKPVERTILPDNPKKVILQRTGAIKRLGRKPLMPDGRLTPESTILTDKQFPLSDRAGANYQQGPGASARNYLHNTTSEPTRPVALGQNSQRALHDLEPIGPLTEKERLKLESEILTDEQLNEQFALLDRAGANYLHNTTSEPTRPVALGQNSERALRDLEPSATGLVFPRTGSSATQPWASYPTGTELTALAEKNRRQFEAGVSATQPWISYPTGTESTALAGHRRQFEAGVSATQPWVSHPTGTKSTALVGHRPQFEASVSATQPWVSYPTGTESTAVAGHRPQFEGRPQRGFSNTDIHSRPTLDIRSRKDGRGL